MTLKAKLATTGQITRNTPHIDPFFLSPHKQQPPPMNSAKYFAEVTRRQAAEAAMLAKLEKDRQAEGMANFSFKDILQKAVCCVLTRLSLSPRAVGEERK